MYSAVVFFLHIKHAVSQPRHAAASACLNDMCGFCQKRCLSEHAWLCGTYPCLSLYVMREEPPMCIGVYAYTRLCLGIYIYIYRETESERERERALSIEPYARVHIPRAVCGWQFLGVYLDIDMAIDRFFCAGGHALICLPCWCIAYGTHKHTHCKTRSLHRAPLHVQGMYLCIHVCMFPGWPCNKRRVLW